MTMFGKKIFHCGVSILSLGLCLMLTKSSNAAFDARRTFPLPQWQATSWKDGFFVEHEEIPGQGAHLHFNGTYDYNPFGAEQSPNDAYHRVMIHAAVMASLDHFLDIRVALPYAFYQTPASLSSTLGDIRIGAKISITQAVKKITKKELPFGLAIAGDVLVTPMTNDAGRYFNMGPQGTIGGDVKLIIETPHFKDWIWASFNVGGFFGNNILTPEGTGLGEHFIWGAGFTFRPVESWTLHTELFGSVEATGSPVSPPVIWDVGFQRGEENKPYLYGVFSLGLTGSAPRISASIGFGYSWEKVEKKKKVSMIKVSEDGEAFLETVDKPKVKVKEPKEAKEKEKEPEQKAVVLKEDEDGAVFLEKVDKSKEKAAESQPKEKPAEASPAGPAPSPGKAAQPEKKVPQKKAKKPAEDWVYGKEKG